MLQLGPVNPRVQLHVYSSKPSIQTPPLEHGELQQSLKSENYTILYYYNVYICVCVLYNYKQIYIDLIKYSRMNNIS